MPQIPEFTGGELPYTPDRAIANPDALAAPGRAQERLGNTIEGIGGELAKLGQFRDYQYVADQWADATTKWHNELQNRIDTAQQTGDYQGLAAKLKTDVAADLQQRIEDAPSSYAGARLKRHYATLQDQVTNRASIFEHQIGAQDSEAKRLSAYDDFARIARRDPTMADDLIAQATGILAGGERAKDLGITMPPNPLQAEKEEKAFRAQIRGAALIGRAEVDPTGTMADLKSGKYDQDFDVKTREALQPHLQNAIAKGISARLPITPGGGNGAAGGPDQVDNWETQHNNFAGIRKAGVVAGPSAGGFESYSTPEDGVGAIKNLLTVYQDKHGLNTIQGIVSRWAPPSENDTAGLISRAAQVTGFAPDQPLDLHDPAVMQKMIEATIRNEQGGKLPVDPAVIAKVAGAPAAAPATSQPGGGLAQLYARIDGMGLDPEIAAKVKANARVNYDALEADQLRQQRLADQQQKQQSQMAENRIIADAHSDRPTITAKDVANDQALSPDAKLRMIAFLAKDGQADPGLSHQTSIGLMNDIAAGKVTDQAPIIAAFGQGRLNWPDFDHLTKQLADARTPDGERLAKRKSEFLKGIEPQIDKSLFAGFPDLAGKERFYEFQYQIDQKIDEYKKAGKNPADLFDPGKPDYLGKPEALQPYKRMPGEFLKDLDQQLGVPQRERVDLSTKDAIVAAYKSGKIDRATAAAALIDGGFAPAAAPPAAPPAPPIAR